ncbi:MAG: Transcription_WhiB [uncultured Nocardioidaceae bacterium]|uniref:Transcriptional regulator WhiB n=1 Tax=uncultured Nocardioidaceae bacterium TaxID=253824 RepID=A0A6J4L1L8_9ACTN|nr:MAG: Transcription_WhiB [uncultured Nocardioidaceae bacterium]
MHDTTQRVSEDAPHMVARMVRAEMEVIDALGAPSILGPGDHLVAVPRPRAAEDSSDTDQLAGIADLLEPGEGELLWQERALCAQTDPEAFFPEKGGSTREAKKVCLTCDVRAECLEYALANDERFGIWGGLSERERRKLKKRAV